MLKHCYHKYDDNTITIYGGTHLRAQSFTPDVTFTCTGLTVFLSKVGTPTGTLTYSLYLADGSGNPTGGVLATATPAYSALDTVYPGQPLRGVFTPVVLSSGTQYVFTLNLSAGNASNCLKITYKMVGDYADGNDKSSTDGGANWTDTNGDLLFDLWDANTAGITRYYAMMMASSVSRLIQIYTDVNYSTIESAYYCGSTTLGKLLRSENYLYVCFSSGSTTYIHRLTPDLVLDTTWGTSGIVSKQGGLSHASVSQDDWLLLSTTTTWGYLYMLDNTGTQQWTMGVHYYYFLGTAMAATADLCVYCLDTGGGGWVNGYRVKRSDNSTLLNFMSNAAVPKQVAIRESNTHMFAVLGNGNVVLREYQEAADTYLWTTTAFPACGTATCIIHLPNTDLLFVGSTRLNSVSIVKFSGATGDQIATFDTGEKVWDIQVGWDDKLLVCGISASDGVSITTFRRMSTDLTVEWRFDTNFTGTLLGITKSFSVPPEIIAQSGATNVTEGDAIHLFVTATGVPSPTYQWYKNGDLLPGETADTYDIAVSTRTDSGVYTCIASNSTGEDISDDIYVGVFIPNGISSTELLTKLIKQKKLTLCEIYDIELITGTILHYTSYNEDIMWGPQSVLYRAVPITRSDMETHIDLSVDKFVVQAADMAFEFNGVERHLSDGILKNARIILKRICFNAQYGIGLEMLLFDGWISLSYNESSITLDCTSLLDCMNIQIPRFVYQEPCNHRIFDSFCGKDEDDYVEHGTCTSTSTSAYSIIDTAFVINPDDPTYYLRGEIRITSGENLGERRQIYSTIDGQILVTSPFYSRLKIGDTYDYYPGCDLTPETCIARFNNLEHFLGFVYIPRPEQTTYL